MTKTKIMKLYLTLILSFSTLFLFAQSNCIPQSLEEMASSEYDGVNNYYLFSWKNTVIIQECSNYSTTLEIFHDNLTDPNTNLEYPPNDPRRYCTSSSNPSVSFNIDFFNTNTFTLLLGGTFTDKCFWWRLVVVGNGCAGYRCKTATTWQFIQYS